MQAPLNAARCKKTREEAELFVAQPFILAATGAA